MTTDPTPTAESGSLDLDFRPGDVVRYEPAEWPGRHDRMWCREGMAIADENGLLWDTYWSTGNDCHNLVDREMATARVLFNLADFRELERHEAYTWREFHPDDRALITSQHGLQERRFVRVGSGPDLGTQIENAREALAEAERQVESAKQTVIWRREHLAELEATRDSSPVRTGE